MSNVDEDDDFETDEVEESGNAMKVLRKRDREQSKKIQELEAALAAHQKKDRSLTVAEVLREKGASPKLARYAERDIDGDVTAETVSEWLTENGELFGWTDPEADAQDPTAQEAERISAATSVAQPTKSLTRDANWVGTASKGDLEAFGIQF